MPYRDLAKKRRADAAWHRRRRAQLREEVRLEREAASKHRVREADFREQGFVPVRLSETLRFADHTHERGEILWLRPGDVWWWVEKLKVAQEVGLSESSSIRLIPATGHGLEGEGYDRDDDDRGPERTNAGY